MKIVAIADIHSRIDYQPSVTSILEKADLILIAGDITNFGDCEEAITVIETLLSYNKNLLAVPGNCDRPGVANALASRGINIHATERTFGNVRILGLGGCNKTPFHTPTEYTEPELAAFLNKYQEPAGSGREILVSHAPPHKTKLDRVFLGFHVGSKAIRTYIEDKRPDVVVCGHIHEARGFDHINETLIINPGPFPKNYAVIDVNERISFELY